MNLAEIDQQLIEKHRTFKEYILSLNEVELVSAPDGKWNPVQHVDHIRRSVTAVADALLLPNFVFRLMFGVANRPSKTFEGLVAKYKFRLSEGGKARGRFVPETMAADKLTLVISRYDSSVEKLRNRIRKWSEPDLDKYILPHPLLGKLTIREMMYFTIYHAEHHHTLCVDQFKKISNNP